MDFGVYIHVPFCRVQCPYCTFFTVLRPADAAPMQAFLEGVAQEWQLRVAPRLQRGDRLRTLYLGGGTPSDLPPEALVAQLCAWDRALRAAGGDGLAALDEVTVECNPESATPALLDGLRAVGAHRVSLGVQSLVDDDLRVLGRGAEAHTVQRALHEVSQRFTNWNADWIVGVPGSRWEFLRDGLAVLCDHGAPHLSFYCLEMPPNQALRLGDIPGEASDAFKADLYLRASDWVTTHGYEHYEISNAARPGFRAVHNQSYWEGRDYVGLGPGAHSLAAGVRRANRPDLRRWQEALARGEDPPHQSETLTEAMRQHERILLGLRRRVGIPVAELGLEEGAPLLDRLVSDGLATLEDAILRLTPRGWLISDSIVLQVVAA